MACGPEACSVLNMFSLVNMLDCHAIWDGSQEQLVAAPVQRIHCAVVHSKSEVGVTALLPWSWREKNAQESEACRADPHSLGGLKGGHTHTHPNSHFMAQLAKVYAIFS